MQLFPDQTIFVQLALFIIFWQVFQYLVVGPMNQVLAERERRTVQAEVTATELAEAVGADRARYEERLHEQRLRMAREAELARHAAIEAANGEIAAARMAITRELAHLREQVGKQVAEARRTLAAEAETIAAEMLARVAGGPRR